MIVTEFLSAALVFVGSTLALTASIGMLRFRSTLARMHPATKPNTFGLLLVFSGTAIRLWDNPDVGMLILAGLFALITAPVVAQCIGQLAYREQRGTAGLTCLSAKPQSPKQS